MNVTLTPDQEHKRTQKLRQDTGHRRTIKQRVTPTTKATHSTTEKDWSIKAKQCEKQGGHEKAAGAWLLLLVVYGYKLLLSRLGISDRI